MPYAPPEPATRASRLAAADARWGQTLAVRPDLEPAVKLQQELLGLVIDLTETVEQGRLPRLSLPPKYLAAKLARGVPALVGEPVPVPTAVLKPTFIKLCDALARGGAGEAAVHIRDLVVNGDLEPGSLFAASLARDQNAIRTGAVHRGVSPDLLWLVGELTVGPFVHALQRLLFHSEEPRLVEALHEWGHGYCPMCGSWPAIAEVAAAHRELRCSFCAATWELTVYACIYCGEAGEPFVTAAPDQERKDRRVEVCQSCGSYLKAVDVQATSPFPLLAISDLETMDLDVAAMEQGYSRPPMKEFAPRR